MRKGRKAFDNGKYFWVIFRPMKYLLSILSLIIVATSLSACNTVKGVGQDVNATGRGISKAASTVEHKIEN